MSIDRNDLIDIGLKVGQAKEFLISLDKYKLQKEQEKEDERKRSLKNLLEVMRRIDLLDTFIDKKVQVSDVLKLSDEDLSNMGVSFRKRIGWSSSIRRFEKRRW